MNAQEWLNRYMSFYIAENVVFYSGKQFNKNGIYLHPIRLTESILIYFSFFQRNKWNNYKNIVCENY